MHLNLIRNLTQGTLSTSQFLAEIRCVELFRVIHLDVSVFLNISIASVQLKGLHHRRTKLGKHNVMFKKFPWCSGKAT